MGRSWLVVSHRVSSSGSKANHPCCWPPYNRRWCNWSCWSSACGLAGGGARGETGCGSCQPQTAHLLKTDVVQHEKKQKQGHTSPNTHATTLNRLTTHRDNFDSCSGRQYFKVPQPFTWVFWVINLGHGYKMPIYQLLKGNTRIINIGRDSRRKGERGDLQQRGNTCRSSSVMKKEGAFAFGCM